MDTCCASDQSGELTYLLLKRPFDAECRLTIRSSGQWAWGSARTSSALSPTAAKRER